MGSIPAVFKRNIATNHPKSLFLPAFHNPMPFHIMLQITNNPMKIQKNMFSPPFIIRGSSLKNFSISIVFYISNNNLLYESFG